MPACNTSPENNRAFGQAVGNDLLKRHGKRRYYTSDEVHASVHRLGYSIDWSCWAMCLFISPEDFIAYHDSIGEVCDLAAMKSEMVAALTDGASSSWFNIDFSWFDWPGVDLSSIFDVFDWS
jgi:hypothetical protein